MREVDLAPTRVELGPTTRLHLSELNAQAVANPRRQQCNAVMVSFSAAHHDLMGFEIDVPNPQRAALEQAEAAAIEDLRDEAEGGLQRFKKAEDYAAREHRREMGGAAGALQAFQGGYFQFEDAPVQEQEGAEGLALGSGRDPTLLREVVQKEGCLRGAHISRVATLVEADECADPGGG